MVQVRQSPSGRFVEIQEGGGDGGGGGEAEPSWADGLRWWAGGAGSFSHVSVGDVLEIDVEWPTIGTPQTVLASWHDSANEVPPAGVALLDAYVLEADLIRVRFWVFGATPTSFNVYVNLVAGNG